MSRICELCGKKPVYGNIILRRGIRKKSGGIGLKTTAVTRRLFLPNLQNVRALVGGTSRRMRVCGACLRAGKVTKIPVRTWKATAPAK